MKPMGAGTIGFWNVKNAATYAQVTQAQIRKYCEAGRIHGPSGQSPFTTEVKGRLQWRVPVNFQVTPPVPEKKVSPFSGMSPSEKDRQFAENTKIA